MPDGWAGKKISEEDRKASRFRHRAASAEARADAHTMLALMGERVEGPAAAVGDALEAARLADLGGAARLFVGSVGSVVLCVVFFFWWVCGAGGSTG
eukprot:scaffold22165_cov45-Isochrysis_galbana.AAC.1